jgi:exopolysaccharide biosynthesis polyprenyl glycosylphosphotransferase
MDLTRPAAGAFFGAIACGAVAAVARAGARVSAHRAPKLRQRTLIVGSGLVADRLAERINDHPELGLELTGFIDDGAGDQGTATLPCLGGLSALSDLVELDLVDRVMIAFTRAHHEELLHALRVCRDAGVAVDIVPRLFEFLDGARSIEQIGGMPLLSIDAPVFSAPSRVSKRTLDLIGAGLTLMLFSPLLIVIAIAIKLDSRGPVLFTQLRSGRGGRFFKLYKFRSMHNEATVEVRPDGAIVKSRDDDRITRVGRLIRRLSLDEAPQLFNVLKGDMSLVGPRPLVMAEAQTLTESWQGRRADLRPGLTGPWQIAGRSNIPFQEMIRFDYQYVAGWSLARDIEILIATIPVVLSGRGAY